MSTSPEAKQAAVEWAKTKSAFGNQGREEFVFAQGYDAATAKLREELELARGLLEEQRNYESIRNTELIQQLVREQLAHHQLGPCHKCVESVDYWHKLYQECSRDFAALRKQQPNEHCGHCDMGYKEDRCTCGSYNLDVALTDTEEKLK